jgi:hypothetical protein
VQFPNTKPLQFRRRTRPTPHNHLLRIMELMRIAHNLHCHIGSASVAGQDFDEVADWVRRLINVTSQHEKAFYGASGTRSREQGTYCRSLKSTWGEKKEKLRRKIKAEDLRIEAAGISRYQTLNLVPLFGRNRTVEFRCFSGTTSGLKMTAWIQMALPNRRVQRSFSAPSTHTCPSTP